MNISSLTTSLFQEDIPIKNKFNSSTKIFSCEANNNDNIIKRQKKWTKEEDQMLLAQVEKYRDTKIKWREISANIKSKTTRQCYSRYAQINPKLSKGLWSKKEDEDLLNNISKYGKKWSLLAKIMKTRSNKQIRDRYLNCLDEKVSRHPFTPEEDKKVLELVLKFGSNWCRIAKEMEGRTGDNIKNRFNWSIRHTMESQIDLQKISK